MRKIQLSKIPKPAFKYNEFQEWLDESHEEFLVEIGCGVGFHPISWAEKNPKSKILAIERTQIKFNKFIDRLQNHPHLTNIFPAHADAGVLLPHLDLIDKIDHYIILYPNPYPKAKQKNLRFAYSSLMDFLISSLKSNGTITFATNIENYANELRLELPKLTSLQLISDMVLDFQSPPRSHFESKYLSRKELCWNLVFKLPQ
jgi:tRNA (guanine-N7-)-methyltransferase